MYAKPDGRERGAVASSPSRAFRGRNVYALSVTLRDAPPHPDDAQARHEVLRRRMVREQVAGRGVQGARVCAAMERVPRHLFVEEALRERAYGDHALPIGERQTLSQPYIVGLMTDALALMGAEKVLEVGTGCGYQTAILAELAARVCSIERIAVLAERAWRTLLALHYRNVVIHQGDGAYGWRDEAPFDAIIVTAGAPDVPPILIAQMKVGGRMVIPIGGRDGQTLKKIVKDEKGITVTPLIPCVFVPLIGAAGFPEGP